MLTDHPAAFFHAVHSRSRLSHIFSSLLKPPPPSFLSSLFSDHLVSYFTKKPGTILKITYICFHFSYICICSHSLCLFPSQQSKDIVLASSFFCTTFPLSVRLFIYEYGSPLWSAEDTFQHPWWRPETQWIVLEPVYTMSFPIYTYLW